MSIFLKWLVFIFFVIFSYANGQNKETSIDSLIIEMDADPGMGRDFSVIKVYPHKNKFTVTYILYDEYNNDDYYKDPELRILSEKYKDVAFDDLPEAYFDRLKKITLRHTIFYTKSIKLKNKMHKDYLQELFRISKLSDKDIKLEKKQNAMYLDALSVSFTFHKKASKNKLTASALEKDNYKTLYHFLVNTFDLYQKKFKDKKFDSIRILKQPSKVIIFKR